jgi:hypothetical protein
LSACATASLVAKILGASAFISPSLAMPGARSPSVPPAASEAAAIEVKDTDYKTWLFEQTIKIRVSNSPSSKILGQVEEGDKIKAFIKPVGDGWFRIKLPNGTDGFFFGNFARESKK